MSRRPIAAPPRWLLAAKAALLALLLVGAIWPSVGGFEGKGMLYRLPIFLAPALIVPVHVAWRRTPWPVAMDAALTLPFLLDTAANGVGLYDAFAPTDDVLHAVNWFLLIGGVTLHLRDRIDAAPPRWLLWLACTGVGALAIIGWEVAEYGVMRAGVGGLSLTYADTLADLVLSSAGGALGAALVLRSRPPAGA